MTQSGWQGNNDNGGNPADHDAPTQFADASSASGHSGQGQPGPSHEVVTAYDQNVNTHGQGYAQGASPAGGPVYGNNPYGAQYGAPNMGPGGHGTGGQAPMGQPSMTSYGAVQYGPPQYGPGIPGVTYDPLTGEPLSDKSKVTAALLQFFFGGFGAGRFYIGSNTIGFVQLGLCIFGWITAIFIVGFFVLAGLGMWALVDAILMLMGNVRDGQGRKLRE